jgi:GNAT superfamily N-acetyltransferase
MISVNNINITYRKVCAEDFDLLLQYLLALSPDSQKRFGPHRFDLDTLSDLYTMGSDHTGYIAFDESNGKIIAYAILKKGYLDHDSQRLESYGIIPNHSTDCTYAPSVVDLYQGQGIGTALFKYILTDLQKTTCSRIILWGGVQADNERAVRYYQHNGFNILGEFQYNGNNYDMFYTIRQ